MMSRRLVAIVAGSAALAVPAAAVAQEEGFLKVTGGGQVIADDQTRGPGDTIAFNAQQTSAEQNDSGSFPAKGQLQVNNRTQGVRFHGVVTCIRELADQEGVVRFGGFQKTRDGSLVPFTVDVTDNGEGGNASDDDMIAFRQRDDSEDPCDDQEFQTQLRSTRLARGNVQTH